MKTREKTSFYLLPQVAFDMYLIRNLNVWHSLEECSKKDVVTEKYLNKSIYLTFQLHSY